MLSKTNIDVKILPVLAPINSGNDGGSLEYGRINYEVQAQNISFQSQAWDQFLASEPGSIDEAKSAKDLSEIYLGASAIQLMRGVKDQDTKTDQANWFTQQSIEIYGTQDVQDTQRVMLDDLRLFSSLTDSNEVDQDDLQKIISIYNELGIVEDQNDNTDIELQHNMDVGDEAFKEFIVENFGQILDYFDGSTLYTASELTDIAKIALDHMKEKDNRWASWKVTTKNDGSMSVSTKEKEIQIGKKRAPALGSEAGPSLVHEVFHALRSINGEEAGDEGLQHGLPGYNDFEEGLGCYIEYVTTGRVPAKISNRQITASLALGQLGDGKQFDRNEIFDILALRTKILLQTEGAVTKELVDAKLLELRTLIIDRFFRGGKGTNPVKSVYTKDVIYAQGFAIAKSYVGEKIKNGTSSKKLFSFLYSGKFDPTKKEHQDRLNELGVDSV